MIAGMKKFYLFFSGDPSFFLRDVQKEGIVEISRFPEVSGFVGISISMTEINEKAKKTDFLKKTLKVVEGKEFSGKIVITRDEEEKAVQEFPLDDIYERFYKISQEIERRKKIVEKIEGIKKELLPVKELEVVPSELFSMKNFSFFLFSLPEKQPVPDKIGGFDVERVGDSNIFLIIFPVEKKKEIISEIEGKKGTIINIRRWSRLPSEVFKKLEYVEEKNRKEISEAETLLKEILPLKYKILVFSDYVNSLLEYVKAKQNTGISRFVRCIQGWIKVQDIPRLETLVSKHFPDGYLYISEPDVKDDIPVALENTPFIQPFEVVTDLYGRPVYNNMDPTPHLSLFFALSFAFCLTDAAYGIILMVLSLIFLKKFKYFPSVSKFFKLLLYGGFATLLLGGITGGWFGDILSRLPSTFFPVKVLKKVTVLNPLEGGNSTFLFLGWALVLGYIQILWGLWLNLWNSVRRYGFKMSGEPVILLSIQILVGLIIISFIASWKEAIPLLSVLLGLSFVSLMILKGATQKGFFMKFFWAFYGAYNVIAGNLLGDVLSYSRLFGLGLTTGVLAIVVNEMVSLSTGIPYVGYIIAVVLFVFGHLGNLALNLLGGYVHTSRLQYLEFFTKFFEGGGRPFSPLKEPRQYTFIKDTHPSE